MDEVQIPFSAIEKILRFCEDNLDADFPEEYAQRCQDLKQVYQAIAVAKGTTIEAVIQERNMILRDGAETEEEGIEPDNDDSLSHYANYYSNESDYLLAEYPEVFGYSDVE